MIGRTRGHLRTSFPSGARLSKQSPTAWPWRMDGRGRTPVTPAPSSSWGKSSSLLPSSRPPRDATQAPLTYDASLIQASCEPRALISSRIRPIARLAMRNGSRSELLAIMIS